jgi:hypothetical protein
MLAKDLYKVGATRVGLQKINPKERQLQLNVHDPSPTQRPRSISASSPTILSKSVKEKSVKATKKDHFLQSLQNQNALLHAFACFCTLLHAFFAESTMVKVGAVNDNGVLTLGEWLFACVARSFVHSFIHSFVRSFVRSLVMVVVVVVVVVVMVMVVMVMVVLVLVLILLSTTMEY